jgi:hypothetical protein
VIGANSEIGQIATKLFSIMHMLRFSLLSLSKRNLLQSIERLISN